MSCCVLFHGRLVTDWSVSERGLGGHRNIETTDENNLRSKDAMYQVITGLDTNFSLHLPSWKVMLALLVLSIWKISTDKQVDFSQF